MKRYHVYSLIIVTVFIACDFAIKSKQQDYSQSIGQVINLFQDHQIVALGEHHGRLRESQFRLQLIRHPEFANHVDVVVVEFANPLYQEILDDYIMGNYVSRENFKKVWQNTTQVSGVWDSPIYEEFFRTVREINLKLPKNDRIRVLAADPPIDWSKVNHWEDFKPFTNRGSYPIGIIQKEVYGENLKALLLFGTVHTELRGIGFTNELLSEHPNSIAVILPPELNEKSTRIIKTVVNSESTNELLSLVNTDLGNSLYKDFTGDNRFSGKLKDAGHYFLFLGFQVDGVVPVPQEVINDSVYQKERRRRMQILIDR